MYILLLFTSLISSSDFDIETTRIGVFDSQSICETVGDNIVDKKGEIHTLQYSGFELSYICVEKG